ncbi:YjzC family protein [Halobacillus sp. B23F22_1]|uniref:YjzC family protein n=1 Tax=Halobacillus sp. B23F22_1 TaxID=3459514 RepID=UPI00373FB9F9
MNEGNENQLTEDEKHLELRSGDTFPPTRSNKDAVYWKKSFCKLRCMFMTQK